MKELHDKAVSESKYAEAARILSYNELIANYGTAWISILFMTTALHITPFWIRLRHFYYPYNQQQLDFRRLVLGIPFKSDEKSLNPNLSRCLLYSTCIYIIYYQINSRYLNYSRRRTLESSTQ